MEDDEKIIFLLTQFNIQDEIFDLSSSNDD